MRATLAGMSAEPQAILPDSVPPRDAAVAPTLALAIERLTHRYTDVDVLRNLELQLPAGEYACLLGDSGSGKSTLLQLIAGIEHAQTGRIEIAGREVAAPSSGLHVPPEDRGLGMVFQDQALWPHLTVQTHLEFPLRARRRPVDRQALADLLQRVGLDGLEQRRPGALSGGQRQRVGLARALAANPRLLLLDEPLSAVDTAMRAELRSYLKRLFEELGFTALHVTHDPDEAFELGTRVGVLERGELVQWGTPQDLYRRPATINVARLSGVCGVVEVECLERRGASARMNWQGAVYEVPAHADVRVGRAQLVLRPDALQPAENGMPASIEGARFQGDRWLARVRLGDSEPLPVHLAELSAPSRFLRLRESAAWLLPINR
ncbi:ABC transporter ATP-binding protein [Acidihalobacter prosperus]